MAYDTRRSMGTRRSRNQTREREQLANRRIRGLQRDIHPFRWCPEREVSILVGPDHTCPACGDQTAAS
jgi:hypothetical protein